MLYNSATVLTLGDSTLSAQNVWCNPNITNPVTAEYTVAAGTTPSYPLSSCNAVSGTASVTATCLAGTGWCRLVFDLDI